MRKRVSWLGFAAFALAAALRPDADAAPEDVRPGEIRAVFRREGTVLRAEPQALATRTATLPYGTRVRVEEIRETWARVTTVPAAGVEASTGWLRTLETVQPHALTGGGQRGPAAGVGGRTALAAREVSAAGRQLDAATEQGYRAAHPDVERAYPLVDRIERASSALDPALVDAFVREGRLGRPGR